MIPPAVREVLQFNEIEELDMTALLPVALRWPQVPKTLRFGNG